MNATLQKPQTTEDAAQQQSVPESVQKSSTPELSTETARAEQETVKTRQVSSPVVISTPAPLETMDKGRFAIGILLSSSGVGLLLFVAIGMLHHVGTSGWFSLPIIAFTVICGVMMLGGGFGLMATAAPSLDNGEFDRLMEAVNISNVCKDRSETTRESLDAEHRSDVPAGSSSEQRDADKV